MKLQQSNMAIVWRTDYLGLATDVGRGIAVDANGNAFITGNFSSNVITIPGSGSLTKIGKDDRITAKLNGITGSTDWIKQEGSPGTSYSGNDIALDNENNVYVTGHQNFSIWVGKYNNVSGSPIWQETMVHSTGGGQGLSLAMGPSSESAYITGYFSGTCLFNPPMGLTAVFQDMFILQLNDYDGGFISTLINEGLVSSGIEPGLHAIAVDPYGCIYTTGAFKQADFDPNGTYALTASGMQDAFFQKLCCCCINHDDFLDRVALGWHIIDLVDCQVSVGTGWFSISNTWINQFTECHYITTTEPDWGDGTVATPELTPANGIWQHTYSHTGKYGICAWVVELDNGNECWRELMCDTIVVCCDEPPPVYIDHHSVCNTLEMYEVPLNYTGNYCDVSWVQWYYKPCGTPSSGWIPYQITKNMFPLKFSPREFSEETCLDLKAEVHFNCNECGNMVSYAYNSINLCHPLTLNIQNPNPAWSCSTIPVPSPISADVVSYPPVSGCDYENIEWYWNYHEPAGLPVHTGNSYQPPSLEFKGESDDCYTEHIFTAKAYPKSEGCNVVTKTTRIRIYNPEIPPGTITIDPAETLPFCPGEDATLKYNPKCAESPFTYKWYAKTSATDWEFVSDNFEKSLLYNTNRLYETTWFKVAQSGRCLPEPMELEIQVKNPIEIVDFTATPDPCSENHVDLSLEFTPSPIPGEECHYSITWLRNGISIGNSQGIASPINFSYANNSGSVAGSYSAVIHDICCPKNSPVPSDTITIVPSCIPVITGPCYHCFNNNNPIVLSVLMILPPDKPCPVGNVCTYKWFRDGNLVQSGAGSVLLSDDAGEFRVEVTCQTENGTCIREVSHIVVQCDGPCQNFPFDMHIESTVVLPGISFKEHARNTLTAGDPYYYIVKPGGHSEFSACQRIHLLKGFTAEPGCYFRAYIRNLCCGEKSAEIVNSQLSWSEQIVEFRENNLYRIYPNPTTGSFTIEFLDTQIDIDNATTHVEIFNLIGNRVYCADLPFQKQYSISLAGQKPGMYTIRVVHKSKLGVDRIVRQ
jgi:hypothetical protein